MKTNIAFSILFPALANAGPNPFRFLAASHKLSNIARNLPSQAFTRANIGRRHLQAGSCGQDCCTPCALGLEPTRLETVIDFGDFGDDETMTSMTCEEGAAIASSFPADDESCPGLQLAGYAFCGCPSPPNMDGVEDMCTLCYDGSPVPDPEMTVDMGDGEPVSCGMAQISMIFLGAMMSGFDDTGFELSTMEGAGEGPTDPNAEDIDICPIMQATVGAMCGCPADPSAKAGCDICPPGTVLANPNKAITIDEESGGTTSMTCELGAQQASIVPSDDSFCAEIQAEAVNAGCECEGLPTSESSTSGIADTGINQPSNDAGGVINTFSISAIASFTVVAIIM